MDNYKEMNKLIFTNMGDEEIQETIHHELLPNDLRMIISGPSGCGKTNMARNLMTKTTTWSHLYVITLSPSQSIYDHIRDEENVTFLDIKQKSEFKENCLILFDDYMMVKDQSLPKDLFHRGRHKKHNVIYITQRFSETDLVIRNNANIVILFKCDNTSKEVAYNMYLFGDLDLNEFESIQLTSRRDYLVISPEEKLLRNFLPLDYKETKHIIRKKKKSKKIIRVYYWIIDNIIN